MTQACSLSSMEAFSLPPSRAHSCFPSGSAFFRAGCGVPAPKEVIGVPCGFTLKPTANGHLPPMNMNLTFRGSWFGPFSIERDILSRTSGSGSEKGGRVLEKPSNRLTLISPTLKCSSFFYFGNKQLELWGGVLLPPKETGQPGGRCAQLGSDRCPFLVDFV